MKTFEIFRTGTHTTSKGETLSFGDADLGAIASGYDPDGHLAPIVVGHPKQDAPAYGWIKSLKVEAGRLVAEPDQLNPDFAELVRSGAFKKVSAAFYAPASAGNPTPGRYHLRHVGFLGAQPPAVKGLKPVEFDDGDAVVFEFSDSDLVFRNAWALESLSKLFRGLRDYFIETTDAETAEKFCPTGRSTIWHGQPPTCAPRAERWRRGPPFPRPQPRTTPWMRMPRSGRQHLMRAKPS
nr:hypothetical protein [Marinicella sp. W31]MDC2878308.1 hypothetical protein [Marinicella sp. W31]